MSRDARGPGTAGFALIEALVALLLLATALLGAGAAVVEALAEQHAALLRTRATDLSADLAEALRRVGPAETAHSEFVTWEQEVRRHLPLAEIQVHAPDDEAETADDLPADLHIQLRWRANRSGARHELRLPVVLAGPVLLPLP